jgi:hypothetical protein
VLGYFQQRLATPLVLAALHHKFVKERTPFYQRNGKDIVRHYRYFTLAENRGEAQVGRIYKYNLPKMG